MYENNGYACNMPKTFVRRGGVFPGGRSPPLTYGRGHQMIRYAEITLYSGLVYGYEFRKTSGSFSFGYLELDNSSWEFD